jgi:hypothetical protein
VPFQWADAARTLLGACSSCSISPLPPSSPPPPALATRLLLGRYLRDTDYADAGDFLEGGALHGKFHVYCGGFPNRRTGNDWGDMSDTRSAAFDPIFFLHHW